MFKKPVLAEAGSSLSDPPSPCTASRAFPWARPRIGYRIPQGGFRDLTPGAYGLVREEARREERQAWARRRLRQRVENAAGGFFPRSLNLRIGYRRAGDCREGLDSQLQWVWLHSICSTIE